MIWSPRCADLWACHPQVIVIGHDWGSQLASRLLLHHPSRFVGTKIESPFLIVLGEKDPAVPLQATEGTDKFLMNHRIVSLPCGHWIPQESGPAVARTVVKWLEELNR